MDRSLGARCGYQEMVYIILLSGELFLMYIVSSSMESFFRTLQAECTDTVVSLPRICLCKSPERTKKLLDK